jgi:hypothetical protein
VLRDGVARRGGERGAAEVAGRGVALVRRLGERAGDHPVEVAVGTVLAHGRRRLGEVRPELRLVVVAGERRAPGERVVEEAAEAVDVGARVDPLAADLLRRDEVERADPVPGPRRALRDLALREAEVGEVDVVFGAEQDVGGLDVPVDEAGGVRGVERGADLGDDPRHARRGQWAGAAHERAQVVAGHVAHRDERDAVLLARVVDRDHVRVVDRRGDLRLAHETAPDRGVLHQRGRDDLQRDGPVERELHRPVDDAHPAPAGDRLDAMPGEQASRRQLAHGCGVYRPRMVEEHGGAETDPFITGCARPAILPERSAAAAAPGE